METPSFAREIDETADPDTHVLDLTREQDREKLGRVVRIMSEQAVFSELSMLARTASDRSKMVRPRVAAAARRS